MMTEQGNEYWTDLIIDSLIQNLTEDKKLELEQWLELSDSNKEYYRDLVSIWESAGIIMKSQDYDSSKAYKTFKNKIKHYQQSKRVGFRHLAYAASIILICLSTYLAFSTSKLGQQLNQKASITKIEVPNGSRIQTELSDGTLVWVNSGSTIELSPDFGIEDRRIKLYGEAYFNVKTDKKKPFVVETSGVDIKVHGTEFNVETYEEDGIIAVALLEGKVEVTSHSGKSTTLRPRDLALYHITTDKTEVLPDGIGSSLAWRDNKLIFKNETFANIALTLERNFDIKVDIHNPDLLKMRFTGDFVNNETYEQIFRIMSSSGKFRYKINGNQIDIY